MAGKTKTGYVVVALGWEYNDEVMYHGESGGGIPTRVCFNKQLAEKRAERSTAEDIRGEDLGRFGYSLDEVVSTERYKELVEVLDLHNEEDNEDSDPESVLGSWWEKGAKIDKNLSIEKAIEVARCLELEWYQVVEVEVEVE